MFARVSAIRPMGFGLARSRVIRHLSPVSIDIINHLEYKSLSTSIFLSVLFVGKIVTDLAEQSVVAERDYDSGSDDDGYDADDDMANSSKDYYDSDYDTCDDAYYSGDDSK